MLKVFVHFINVSVVGTDTVPVVAPQEQLLSRLSCNPHFQPYHLLEQSIQVSHCRGLLKVKSNTTSDPSVAEAGVIVATVGALLLSIIVPVAETVPLAMLVSSTSSIVSAVVGTDTVQ
jgi:hypothetical protein